MAHSYRQLETFSGPTQYACPLFAARGLAGAGRRLSPSVLALFRYEEPHGSDMAVLPEPCHEHTDYTILTLIPEHSGPGLELLDFEAFEFRDVTQLAPPSPEGQRWVLCCAGLL